MRPSRSASLRWWRHAVVTGILLAACDTTEPSGLTPADVNGTWNLSFTEACGAPSTTAFHLTVSFLDDGQTGTVGSYWVVGSSSLQRAATGQIRFSDGKMDLLLWGQINQSALALTGTVTEGGQFSGTARDPAPGYGGVFVLGSVCDYTVAGTKQ